jgi:hypothetical protein
MTTNTPLWVREHGRACDVPDQIAHDPRLIDISWHNDVSPSFMLASADGIAEIDVRLWVAPVKVEDREFDGPRFQVFDHAHNDFVMFASETDIAGALDALVRLTNEAATRLLIGE